MVERVSGVALVAALALPLLIGGYFGGLGAVGMVVGVWFGGQAAWELICTAPAGPDPAFCDRALTGWGIMAIPAAVLIGMIGVGVRSLVATIREMRRRRARHPGNRAD